MVYENDQPSQYNWPHQPRKVYCLWQKRVSRDISMKEVASAIRHTKTLLNLQIQYNKLPLFKIQLIVWDELSLSNTTHVCQLEDNLL